MLVTCLHYKQLAIPTIVSFPVHRAVGSGRRRLATAAPPRDQFPYPLHPRPTPYQIFRLPAGASQKQVKTRYYELVRVHHPDSLHSRASGLPKRIRDERFSAIKDAYDVLTGKKPGHASRWNSPDSGRDWELRSELERRRHRRASWEPRVYPYSQSHYTHQHAPSTNGAMTSEDRRRDNILICVAFLSGIMSFLPGFIWSPVEHERRHEQASENLARARQEAKEFGVRRREEIRERVREFRRLGEKSTVDFETDRVKEHDD
ncbi:hypothetical protein BDM02DRAFT_2246807 [Thelephora ganbajun]|uniref:Uncharacterized protein n=1 Tax=Thelephora ganbajun TaxID=370292 RepID=A0ACB6ZG09_THEGA|nr:hypothetical protein BDM02DRAFT_2246807 [Thelephora ganbajun]